MAEMTPEEFTGKWQERLRRSYRSKRHMIDKWRILSDFYQGRYFAEDSTTGRVSANLLFSIIRQKMATLYAQNPKMWFKGQSQAGVEAAPVMEHFMGFVRRVIDAENEERTILFHALLYGTGILKHGFNAEYAIETPLTDDSVLKKLQKRGQLPVLNVSVDDMDLSTGIFSEHNLRIRGGYPWVKAIPPQDYFVDSEAMEFDECRWKAHRFRRPYVDVIRDSRYDEEGREKLQPSGTSIHAIGDDRDELRRHARDGRQDENQDAAMVSLYEIWDAENNEIIVIPDTMSKPLMRVPEPLGLVDGPYEELIFYRDDHGPWGISDADQYAPLAEAINKIGSDMLDHLSRYAATRGIYKTDIMSPDEAQQIVEAENGVLIGVDWNADQDLANAINIFPQQTINADAWRLTDLFRSHMDEVSGVNENARGGSSSTETATEATLISQQGSLRAQDQAYQLTRVLRRSTRRLVEIVKNFWPAERLVPIVGPDGVVFELAHMTRDDVMSAYEVDIEPGSTESFSGPARVRQIIDSIREFAGIEPFLNQQGAGFNWIELAKALLKAIALSKNPEKFLILPQPQPQAQQLGAQQPQNVLPFAQQPGSAPVNPQGQLPTELAGFEPGRALSEAGAV